MSDSGQLEVFEPSFTPPGSPPEPSFQMEEIPTDHVHDHPHPLEHEHEHVDQQLEQEVHHHLEDLGSADRSLMSGEDMPVDMSLIDQPLDLKRGREKEGSPRAGLTTGDWQVCSLAYFVCQAAYL